MIITDVLRGLLPAEAYSPNATVVARFLEAEARLFTEIGAALDRVHGAMYPDSATQDIDAWERLYSLVPMPGMSFQQRAQAVRSKQAEVGGLSKDYFKQLARAAGYKVTILEPSPFEVGISRCGDALYQEEIRYVWQVHVDGRPGDATHASDEALRATFVDLKAAHTYCQFMTS